MWVLATLSPSLCPVVLIGKMGPWAPGLWQGQNDCQCLGPVGTGASRGADLSLTDIDECAQGAGILCTFRCINVPGSYQCACPEHGYAMTANGRSCKGKQGVPAPPVPRAGSEQAQKALHSLLCDRSYDT